VFGIVTPFEEAADVIPALAHHGVRLVQFNISPGFFESPQEAKPKALRSLSELKEAVRVAQENGLQSLIVLDDCNFPRPNIPLPIFLREALADADSLLWFTLPENCSSPSAILQGDNALQREMPTASPLSAKGCCFVPLSLLFEKGMNNDTDLNTITRENRARLKAALGTRIGLKLSGVEELSSYVIGMISDTHQKGDGRVKEDLPIFCPLTLGIIPRGAAEEGVTPEVLRFAMQLVNFSSALVSASAVSSPSLSFAQLWASTVGVFDLLSAWGELAGITVKVRADAPLSAAAVKSPGQLAVCLINPAEEPQDCRLILSLPPGRYTVASRSLVLGRRLADDEEARSALGTDTDSSPVTVSTSVPPRSISVFRLVNHPYQAYKSFTPLLAALDVRQSPSLPATQRRLVKTILSEARLSALATLNYAYRNPRRAATAAHRSLLKLAQAEAMLKNLLLARPSLKEVVTPAIVSLEEVADHLSESSAACLALELKADVVEGKNNVYAVSLRVTNRGPVILRKVSLSCETGAEARCDSQEPIRPATLPPGATAVGKCSVSVTAAGQGFFSVPLTVYVSYWVFNSFSRLPRQVEVPVR